jgi:hypothetical protein
MASQRKGGKGWDRRDKEERVGKEWDCRDSEERNDMAEAERKGSWHHG